MLKDCIEVFQENFQKKGESFILDDYVPKEGTYIIVRKKDQGFEADEPFDIRYDKKEKKMIGSDHSSFRDVCFYDYYSKLIEMNKPIKSKTIHTNNYLSFAVRKVILKEGKLTQEIIDGYYDTLADPRRKYNKAKTRALYDDVERKKGMVNQELLSSIKDWVRQWATHLDIALEGKDYLKLFFVLEDKAETEELYRKEGMRYILPNIYNSNDFNIEVEGQILGLPNDNMCMNSKKPYLANKTRGMVQQPYLLNREEALTQFQFFDYLMGMASKQQYNVYIDTDMRTIKGYAAGHRPESRMSGYFLRLRKEKNEVAIQNFDTIANYNPNLTPNFRYKTFVKIDDEQEQLINKGYVLEEIVDDIFFNKILISNYFTEPGDMRIRDGILRNNLLIARDRINAWFQGNEGVDISTLLKVVSKALIENSLSKGYLKKAKKQLNLRWSFYDYFAGTDEMEVTMNKVEEAIRNHIRMNDGTWEFDNAEEYYFAVGQMVDYFISKSRAAKKPLSFVNAFLNMKNDKFIKRELQRLFKKYNYDMFPHEKRANRLLSRIMLYDPAQPVNVDMIIAGILSDNVIFEKTSVSSGGTK